MVTIIIEILPVYILTLFIHTNLRIPVGLQFSSGADAFVISGTFMSFGIMWQIVVAALALKQALMNKLENKYKEQEAKTFGNFLYQAFKGANSGQNLLFAISTVALFFISMFVIMKGIGIGNPIDLTSPEVVVTIVPIVSIMLLANIAWIGANFIKAYVNYSQQKQKQSQQPE